MPSELIKEKISILEQQKAYILATVEETLDNMLDEFMRNNGLNKNDMDKEKAEAISKIFKVDTKPILIGDRIKKIDKEIEALRQQL